MVTVMLQWPAATFGRRELRRAGAERTVYWTYEGDILGFADEATVNTPRDDVSPATTFAKAANGNTIPFDYVYETKMTGDVGLEKAVNLARYD